MEAAILGPTVLGLLLLPILAVLLMALCLHCRELPTSYDSASSDSLYPGNMLIKRPHTLAPWPPVTSYPPLSQPDLLPIPRSPQPPGGSHQVSSTQQDTNSANSVVSYENEGASGIPDGLAGVERLGPDLALLTPVFPLELACEDADEDDDEDDYHNEGYLEVLPDSTPAPSAAVPPAPAPSNPGLRDSAFSMELGEDYVNVPESEDSAEASLGGSREYVNVPEELQPTARTKTATLSSQEVEEEEEEEEGAPDYENLQELN
ncbi:linker for activation of T-cells family member 1 [Choloepus didactylus]|uniref:linker for activation of T-cells family member 1 n=1 Tax=Choloepus didactylus TaxID=27675 RepID=UPI0018A06F7C|nr:linker for activation of T-cells family member 1 [Choloepus didactylus]XP_037670132.1 linker for activation of T-cells family member 1 [Choloepus didactylus]XP_037670133.1 linker for activation of T-cells family member 1 [Choloepus didactylus]